MKQVTLCIPLYNAETTIGRTLESLVNQDYPLYKIKIFDNVSTDSSRDICRDVAKKYSFIELHVNETNIGAEANFTKCIMEAEGDYCALVHSDDIYESDFVSRSLDVLENNPDCVATICGAYEIDSNEFIIGKRFIPKEISKHEISFLTRQDLLVLIYKYANFITCPSVFVRSSVYVEKIKVWNGQNYKTSADLDVWLRLSEFGKIASIRNPLMKYRVADASYSYRIAKKRTTKHDVFLVLDQYQNVSNISDYNFLALKDQAIRSLNMIRNNKREVGFPCEVKFNFFLVLKKMCHSKWHFKMGLAILAIKILTSFFSLIRWNHECKK